MSVSLPFAEALCEPLSLGTIVAGSLGLLILGGLLGELLRRSPTALYRASVSLISCAGFLFVLFEPALREPLLQFLVDSAWLISMVGILFITTWSTTRSTKANLASMVPFFFMQTMLLICIATLCLFLFHMEAAEDDIPVATLLLTLFFMALGVGNQYNTWLGADRLKRNARDRKASSALLENDR
ncbi:MAG: hypothetical protein CME36_19900 [unclassified Hahellaceae]|nr:hypothetical protein [Hahellaceae bacterium]|tara:strand:+ start:14217 stop:14771 length:555 start_codon:yes stop_codon:yes gene_type:complete